MTRRWHNGPFGWVLFFAVLKAAALASAADLPEQAKIRIGRQKQLFVDDYAIARRSRVRRELGTVTKANQGKPIFTDGLFYGTVLHDAGRFKLWYRKPGRAGFGYAESADGLQFEKRADVRGINFAGDYSLSVEKHAQASGEKQKFLAAYDAPGMAAGIAQSADGIQWTPLNAGKPVTHRAADTYNQILYDRRAQTYRLFTRTDFGTPGGDGEVRGTRSMLNPDVFRKPKNWKLVRQWIFDREGKQEIHRRQIYATTCWIYEGIYFGLLTVYEFPGDFREGKKTDRITRHDRDVMNFYIATSRDADSWDLQWVYAGKPLVPRGPQGSFDKDLILPASTIVTHAGKHWLYYSGANERHGGPGVVFAREHAIGLATLRLDGFVCLAAGSQPGTVVTRPFRFEGRSLKINVAAPAGVVRLEILDARGQPIALYAGRQAARGAKVDSVAWTPRWSAANDLAALKGRTVRLRFTLENARLYAFQVQ